MDDLAATVAAVRYFNRFYTSRIGLLADAHQQTDFSLTEARVLYELAQRPGLTAACLGNELGLDPGYMSRLVKGLEGRDLLERRSVAEDRRRAELHLTDTGRSGVVALEAGTRRALGSLLAPLRSVERSALRAALARIETLLAPTTVTPAPFSLRAPQAGDLGWIIHRQARLYAEEFGWDASFEGLVAEICADFVRGFKPGRDSAWVADLGGAVVGSVFLVERASDIAQLRLLYVEAEARGMGIGRALVNACIDFARSAGYRTLILWTNDVLVDARRLYESAGFRLTDSAPHRAFGVDLVGQNWELDLLALPDPGS